MPEDEAAIADNVLRILEAATGTPVDEIDFEQSLADGLGLDKKKLQELAYAFNKDDYFKPMGVGLIPDDVADCLTVDELVALVESELNYDAPQRRAKPQQNKPPKK
jgi:hypothetical protein